MRIGLLTVRSTPQYSLGGRAQPAAVGPLRVLADASALRIAKHPAPAGEHVHFSPAAERDALRHYGHGIPPVASRIVTPRAIRKMSAARTVTTKSKMTRRKFSA